MIVKKNLPWIRMLFTVKGSSFTETWPRVLVVTTVAIIVTFIELKWDLKEDYSITSAPFSLIGIALSIFLGFRNNAAYDRFWEGRKLWGALVNTARSLARQTFTLFHLPDEKVNDTAEKAELEEFQEKFVRRVIAFVYTLCHHLRNEDPVQDISPYLPADDLAEVEQSSNRPVAILQQLGRDLAYARSRKWIHELSAPFIDAQLVELSNILGGCERIKNTPIPFAYTVLIHQIVAFYCFFLPFGLIKDADVMTPVIVLLVAHAFFGLDAIGDELEQPFGTQPNDLPLATISRTIEINLLELIQDPNRPEPLSEVDGMLR